MCIVHTHIDKSTSFQEFHKCYDFNMILHRVQKKKKILHLYGTKCIFVYKFTNPNRTPVTFTGPKTFLNKLSRKLPYGLFVLLMRTTVHGPSSSKKRTFYHNRTYCSN